ncbi:MAG: hypothetical protein GF341_11150 [candidate division Zixibacteria bacterium]|nr:hypothetical protein [candidate division Zixibacteria bacterium]
MSDEHTHNEHDTPQHGADTGYEKGDVNVGRMLVFTAIAIVFTLLVVVFMNEFFVFEKERVIQEMVLSPESKELRELRAREDRELHSYAVIDTANGVYRIPIERAMQLMADEAFQERTGTDYR